MFDRIKDAASDLLGGNVEDAISGLAGDEQVADMASNFGQNTELIQGLDFPASQEDLIAQLQERGADSGLITQIMESHQGQFNGIGDVLNTIRNR